MVRVGGGGVKNQPKPKLLKQRSKKARRASCCGERGESFHPSLGSQVLHSAALPSSPHLAAVRQVATSALRPPPITTRIGRPTTATTCPSSAHPVGRRSLANNMPAAQSASAPSEAVETLTTHNVYELVLDGERLKQPVFIYCVPNQ